jgi:hypothetical protein
MSFVLHSLEEIPDCSGVLPPVAVLAHGHSQPAEIWRRVHQVLPTGGNLQTDRSSRKSREEQRTARSSKADQPAYRAKDIAIVCWLLLAAWRLGLLSSYVESLLPTGMYQSYSSLRILPCGRHPRSPMQITPQKSATVPRSHNRVGQENRPLERLSLLISVVIAVNAP